MSTQAIIVTLLVLLLVVLAVLLMVWRYLHSHRQRLNHLHEKTDQVLASQEGGRMQTSRQGDELRHQQTRIMERMQTILLRLESWWKDRDRRP